MEDSLSNDAGWRQLAQRWSVGDGPALANEVLARLLAGRPLSELPLETVDGRVDLRGLVVPKPQASSPKTYTVKLPDGVEFTQTWVTLDGLIEFKGVELKDLDLRAANLPHLRFFHTRIDNCRFDKAGCQDWRLWASDIVDSSFDGADLTDLSVGAHYDGKPNRLERLNLRQASLSGTRTRYWGVAEVTDCDFSFATIDDVNFFQASLVRCTFAGALRKVIFDGRVLKPEEKSSPNPMEDIDMTGVTVFEGVSFRGVHFDRIRLPENPDIVVVKSGEWLNRALSTIEDRDDLPARIVSGWLENLIKFTLPNGGDCFINLGRMQEGRRLMEQLLTEFAPTTIS